MRSGYQPLAVAPNGKKPLHKDWSNRDISLDEVLSKDTDRYGIRCGDNGLMCIDVDSKHHDNPELMNKTFIDRITCSVLDLDKVVFQKTPSAGGHLFYRADTPQKNTVYSKNQEGLRLVESRGVGGQAGMYELDKCAQIADLPVLTKREEAVILEAARSFHEYKRQPNSFAEYNQTTSCVDLLLEQGWTVVSEDDVMYKVLRDGNPTSSTSASVYKDSNCAYVFSTSTKLPANKLLTPADISIELTFGGDTKAFAKAMGLIYLASMLSRVATTLKAPVMGVNKLILLGSGGRLQNQMFLGRRISWNLTTMKSIHMTGGVVQTCALQFAASRTE